ncbi:hypothetical protein CLF_111361 [Clonorchis sinensis]|uniref:Uncharacterized protein n=1 Tax=Clonorchis sinensis TaxID=79923 RepID=G7YUQ2_CLOSI|nr:hypothetical protein CLF_111361 [Clonorchis sinensis]
MRRPGAAHSVAWKHHKREIQLGSRYWKPVAHGSIFIRTASSAQSDLAYDMSCCIVPPANDSPLLPERTDCTCVISRYGQFTLTNNPYQYVCTPFGAYLLLIPGGSAASLTIFLLLQFALLLIACFASFKMFSNGPTRILATREKRRSLLRNCLLEKHQLNSYRLLDSGAKLSSASRLHN